jgi:hypothetical protein
MDALSYIQYSECFGKFAANLDDMISIIQILEHMPNSDYSQFYKTRKNIVKFYFQCLESHKLVTKQVLEAWVSDGARSGGLTVYLNNSDLAQEKFNASKPIAELLHQIEKIHLDHQKSLRIQSRIQRLGY